MSVWLRGLFDRQNETVFGENSYLYNPGMKKLVFLILLFLFTAVNNWFAGTNTPAILATVAVVDHDYRDCELPLGDGEEKSGEEDKDFTEDDDEVGLGHRWMSRDKSSNSNLHFLYQESLFRDLEIEVVIPPPKA